MVLQITEIPPPKFSDGNRDKWPTHLPSLPGPALFSKFLDPLTTILKEAYKTRPDKMYGIDLEVIAKEGGGEFMFMSGAQCRMLPFDYEAFDDGEGGAVFGHPSGIKYTSSADLSSHLLWLIHDDTHDYTNCRCSLCPPYVASFMNNSYTHDVSRLSSIDTQLNYSSNVKKSREIDHDAASDFDRPPAKKIKRQTAHEPLHYPPTYPPLSEEDLEKRKYKDLKKQVHMIVDELEQLAKSVSAEKGKVMRLKMERKKLEEIHAEVKKSDDEESDRMTEGPSLMNSDDDGSEFGARPIKRSSIGPSSLSQSILAEKVSTPKLTTGTKQRRKRAPVDPNAPKRPTNAFMLFCDLSREQLKKERDQMKGNVPGSEEDAGLGNITKALGHKWQNLPKSERERYQELFRNEVRRYNDEMQAYKKQLASKGGALSHENGATKKGLADGSLADIDVEGVELDEADPDEDN